MASIGSLAPDRSTLPHEAADAAAGSPDAARQSALAQAASLQLPEPAATVAAAGQDLLGLAGRIGATGRASSSLAEAGVLPRADGLPTGPRSPDLASALARLSPETDTAALAGLDAATADALVPLVDAVA